jgi:hypothetical protein
MLKINILKTQFISIFRDPKAENNVGINQLVRIHYTLKAIANTKIVC